MLEKVDLLSPKPKQASDIAEANTAVPLPTVNLTEETRKNISLKKVPAKAFELSSEQEVAPEKLKLTAATTPPMTDNIPLTEKSAAADRTNFKFNPDLFSRKHSFEFDFERHKDLALAVARVLGRNYYSAVSNKRNLLSTLGTAAGLGVGAAALPAAGSLLGLGITAGVLYQAYQSGREYKRS